MKYCCLSSIAPTILTTIKYIIILLYDQIYHHSPFHLPLSFYHQYQLYANIYIGTEILKYVQVAGSKPDGIYKRPRAKLHPNHTSTSVECRDLSLPR